MNLSHSTSFKNWTLAIALSSVVIGCGAFDTKKSGEKAKQNDNALSGEWRNNCSKLDWLGMTREIDVLKFSLVGDFDKIATVYSDDACATPYVSISEHGTYAALGDSTTVPSADNINFTVTAATITPMSDEAAKLLNNASYCGVATWQNGQGVDVLDRNCLGRKHLKGEVVFDIYRLDNDNKVLSLGKGSLWLDKSEASARPEKLDLDKTYAKQ